MTFLFLQFVNKTNLKRNRDPNKFLLWFVNKACLLVYC